MASKLLWAIFFMLLMGNIEGQENPAMSHRMHLKLSGNVPHPVTNKAFRRSFTGIYDISLSYRIRLFSNFSAGFQGKHVEWRTPDNKIPGLDTYGHFNSGGLLLSYDYPITENGIMYGAITAGVAQMNYTGLSYDSMPDNFQTKYRFNYGEVELGAYFYTEGSFAIGMQTSMVFTNYGFDPYRLSLDEHKAYTATDLNGNVVQFNLGFSVVYSFLKKRGT
jgi:hypothetical protein